MFSVEVGQKIPLTLQVYDAKETLKVVCVLSSKDGSEFMRVNLDHLHKGFYANFKTEMPDLPLIFAQYFTDEPENYEVVNEVFQAAPKVQAPEKYLIGEVVSTGKLDQNLIIGVVDDSQKNENTNRI